MTSKEKKAITRAVADYVRRQLKNKMKTKNNPFFYNYLSKYKRLLEKSLGFWSFYIKV